MGLVDANSAATSLPAPRPFWAARCSAVKLPLIFDSRSTPLLLQQQPDLASQLTFMNNFLSSILGTQWRLPLAIIANQSSLEGVSNKLPPIKVLKLLWWGQLVTSPLWAQELSFEHLLEIARTHTDRGQASFLPNVSPGSAFPSLPCLPHRTTCHLAYLYPFHTTLVVWN
jgi:hypothetical protein